MKIGIGDYVRTEKGIIGKYNIVKTGKTIPNWNGGYSYEEIDEKYIDKNIYNRFDDEIIKSSPNIIDLIEEGDYVNGKEVFTLIDNQEPKLIATEDGCLNNKEIKSIVTHEQFENIEYKVGE